jgi:hypothetical protein
MQRQLSGSPAYARLTFMLAAMPFMPAGFIFPLLGAMRAPLWPALLGTVVGRTPVLALTAAFFTWIGRLVSTSDDEAALTLGVLAMMLLAMRLVSLVDFAYRAETGRWRMRDPDANAVRVATMFGGPLDDQDPRSDATELEDHHDIVEGELLGEESDDDPPSSGEPAS